MVISVMFFAGFPLIIIPDLAYSIAQPVCRVYHLSICFICLIKRKKKNLLTSRENRVLLKICCLSDIKRYKLRIPSISEGSPTCENPHRRKERK